MQEILRLLMIGYIVNIAGMVILIVLSIRQIQGIEHIKGNVALVNNEDGSTRLIVAPGVKQRSTNVFKNKQAKLMEKKMRR